MAGCPRRSGASSAPWPKSLEFPPPPTTSAPPRRAGAHSEAASPDGPVIRMPASADTPAIRVPTPDTPAIRVPTPDTPATPCRYHPTRPRSACRYHPTRPRSACRYTRHARDPGARRAHAQPEEHRPRHPAQPAGRRSPGLSGSGKSSLAFDTLYAEGQRRYVESLSAYARQFLQLMDKPDVDVIEGLSPAISIEQKATSHNPRSTVGTVTEIHDYLRLLYRARRHAVLPEPRPGAAGAERQPDGRRGAGAAGRDAADGAGAGRARPQGRVRRAVRGHAGAGLRALPRRRRDGRGGRRAEAEEGREARHRRRHRPRQGAACTPPERRCSQRLAESFEAALRIADGRACARARDGRRCREARPSICSAASSPARCADYSLPELEPRLFSFNSPVGACPTCDGLGVTTVFDAERVVAFPSLSLASGAVKGWDRRNAYTFSLLESVARHYGFDIDTPFEELPDRRRARCCCAARARSRSSSSTRPKGAQRQASARSSAGIRSKASCPTSSGACARPIRRRCAKSWRATRARSPAPTATARACAPRRGTCSWSDAADAASKRADLRRRALHAARGAGLVRDAAARRREGRDRRQGDARDPLAPASSSTTSASTT